MTICIFFVDLPKLCKSNHLQKTARSLLKRKPNENLNIYILQCGERGRCQKLFRWNHVEQNQEISKSVLVHIILIVEVSGEESDLAIHYSK